MKAHPLHNRCLWHRLYRPAPCMTNIVGACGLLETQHETTTKPLTKPFVFSRIINETSGFYKQLIYGASIIFIRDTGFDERVIIYRWFRWWFRCGVVFVLTVRPFCVIQLAVLSICVFPYMHPGGCRFEAKLRWCWLVLDFKINAGILTLGRRDESCRFTNKS